MNKLKDCLIVMALTLTLVFPVVVEAQDAGNARTVTAALLDALDAGNYTGAEAMFTPEMAAAVPAARLQAVWESLPAQAGEARGRGEAMIREAEGATLVAVPLHYAGAELVAEVAVTASGKIAGFLVKPGAPPAAPAPAADAGFSERDLMIGEGERSLPATLAMPDGAGPFPAVVLVHGSGPQDRNETIGPNRPFLDIARGLAAQGIAALRYEKRSKARPQDYMANGSLTIDSETTDDAVLALQALHAVAAVDGKRVFVLGHSQGGMMAPRIAAHAIKAGVPVAGLVLMAAPSRKLLDIVLEQQRRLAVLDDGHTSAEEAAAIAKLQQQVVKLRAGEVVALQDSPMNLPAAYWRSVDDVDPVAEAKADALPMLVLQGARDIQVVDADWQGWRDGFHADPAVTFQLYPTLNHLGIAGEGEGNLAEYSKPGHVDSQLIHDTAAWILVH
ncbi:MAG: alpha/beta fold hydrolase [Luteimonas sp.]